MHSLEVIKQMNREAGEKAHEVGEEPKIISAREYDLLNEKIILPVKKIPNLGDYLPEGWKRANADDLGVACPPEYYAGDNEGAGAYLVDSSGFGQPGESALTVDEFVDVVLSLWKNPLQERIGWAICGEGQFQVKIGLFKRVH